MLLVYPSCSWKNQPFGWSKMCLSGIITALKPFLIVITEIGKSFCGACPPFQPLPRRLKLCLSVSMYEELMGTDALLRCACVSANRLIIERDGGA